MKKFLTLMLSVMLLLGCFPSMPAFAAGEFTDVSGHWAEATIVELAQKGIINGKGNGIYDPEGTVTRAEFMKLLVCALGEDDANAKFEKGTLADVKESDWFYAYVASGLKNGVVDVATLDKGNFQPQAGMTRGNVAIWMTNGLGISSDAACTFGDVTDPKEKVAVATATVEGLVAGYQEDNTYRPAKTLTRAEAAIIVKRVMEKNTEMNTLRASENKVEYQQGVKTIESSAQINVIQSMDESTKAIIFGNCTDELKTLSVGEIVYIAPNEKLPTGGCIKAGNINVAGDVVTITCVEPKLEEIFTKIDIAQKIPVTADRYIAGSSADGITLKNENLVADSGDDAVLEFVLALGEIEESFRTGREVSKDFEGVDGLTGSVTVKSDVVADIYLDIFKPSDFSTTVKVENSVTAQVNYKKEGLAEKSWDLASFNIPIYGCISVNLDFDLVFTASGEFEVQATAYCQADVGLKYAKGSVSKINDVNYGASLEANAKGEVTVGPKVTVGLGVSVPMFDDIDVVNVVGNLGVGIKAETAIEHSLDGTNGSLEYSAHNTTPDADGNIHVCDLCIDGSVFIYINGDAGLSSDITDFLECGAVRVEFEGKEWTITDWYCSISTKTGVKFGLGECPNLFKQITYETQPEGKRVTVGEPIALVAKAASVENGPAIVYKWYKDGQEQSGQIGDTYSIAQATVEDSGEYKVKAYYSALGDTILFAESTPVTVEVVPYENGPEFITQPTDAEVQEGYGISLSAEAQMLNGVNVEYQWYKDGSAIAGANASSYAIAQASAADAGVYYCVVWISGFDNLKTESNHATLTVKVSEKKDVSEDSILDTDIFGDSIFDEEDYNVGKNKKQDDNSILDTDIFD